MRICNRTDRVVSYELRGGPLRMTLSTCDLESGEDEEWTPRYRGESVECELIVQCEGERRVRAISSDATVTLRWDDGLLILPD